MPTQLRLDALSGLPPVQAGDRLHELLLASMQASGLQAADGDVLVVAQKIVSKAEDRYRWLAGTEVSPRAQELADRCAKDPRLVEWVLRESREVLRCVPGVLIVEHRLGFVHANAGIDQSNLEADGQLLLLPEDPDRSARQLRDALCLALNCRLAVIVNDSSGRAWRNGVCGIAIGSAGLQPLWDRVGDKDMFGRPLQVTEIGVADELAAAASFLMGQADEAQPAVLVRGAGLPAPQSEPGIAPLLRDRSRDLFR